MKQGLWEVLHKMGVCEEIIFILYYYVYSTSMADFVGLEKLKQMHAE